MNRNDTNILRVGRSKLLSVLFATMLGEKSSPVKSMEFSSIVAL